MPMPRMIILSDTPSVVESVDSVKPMTAKPMIDSTSEHRMTPL